MSNQSTLDEGVGGRIVASRACVECGELVHVTQEPHTHPKPPKTNLEDALDEILVDFFNEAEVDVHSENNQSGTVFTKAGTKAKQQITNLFVSQFLEALPGKWVLEDDDYNAGYNAAIAQIKDTIGRIGK